MQIDQNNIVDFDNDYAEDVDFGDHFAAIDDRNDHDLAGGYEDKLGDFADELGSGDDLFA